MGRRRRTRKAAATTAAAVASSEAAATSTKGSGPRIGRNHVYACTNELGYIRQDVFACLTCMKKDHGGKLMVSGFCASCKMSCHKDHLSSVIELYAKRDFRCDCGNQRMKNACTLLRKDHSVNEHNVYSHNFVGKYCRCDKIYSTNLGSANTMYQCVACEDWYHSDCIKMSNKEMKKKLDSTLFEFTCHECIQELSFLTNYYVRLGCFKPRRLKSVHIPPSKEKISNCIMPSIQLKGRPNTMDFFWKQGFRRQLCTCSDCKVMYKEYNCLYLIDKTEILNMVELPTIRNNTTNHGTVVQAPNTKDIVGTKRRISEGSAEDYNGALERERDSTGDAAKWTAAELEMRDFFWDSATRNVLTPVAIRKFMVGIKELLVDLVSSATEKS